MKTERAVLRASRYRGTKAASCSAVDTFSNRDDGAGSGERCPWLSSEGEHELIHMVAQNAVDVAGQEVEPLACKISFRDSL